MPNIKLTSTESLAVSNKKAWKFDEVCVVDTTKLKFAYLHINLKNIKGEMQCSKYYWIKNDAAPMSSILRNKTCFMK